MAVDQNALILKSPGLPPIMCALQRCETCGTQRQDISTAAKGACNQVPGRVQDTYNFAFGQFLEGLIIGERLDGYGRRWVGSLRF